MGRWEGEGNEWKGGEDGMSGGIEKESRKEVFRGKLA